MRVQAKIEKFGDDFGLRIPKPLIDACGLGEEVDVAIRDKTLVGFRSHLIFQIVFHSVLLDSTHCSVWFSDHENRAQDPKYRNARHCSTRRVERD